MHPHHHLHISTGALFVFALFIVALVGLVLWSKAAKREAARQAERDRMAHEERMSRPVTSSRASAGAYYGEVPSPPPRNSYSGGSSTAYRQAAQPVTAQPVVINTGSSGGMSGGDFMMGMMMGEMLSEPRQTIIEQPTFVEHDYTGYDSSGWSDSSGISYDSGGSDYSDNSGGIDIDW